jgi:hypothetical protein
MKVNKSSTEIITQELDWFQQALLFRDKCSFEQLQAKALIALSLGKIVFRFVHLIKKCQIEMVESQILKNKL